ncbi:cell wall hydrolase [Sphingoaurantiacus capsulatus]|uniref:Cell wall hydrolase n=1 Tax=Sphingoaurantiacus capsulatus TaxID=1771310 RepID=A0ABV7XES9_9SPHN
MNFPVRVALITAASLALLAAGKFPQMIADEAATQTVDSSIYAAPTPDTGAKFQLAAYTPPSGPRLDASIPDDDSIIASDAAKPEVRSLGELVDKIADLPSVELDEEMRCLATAVYFESKGEPLEGQLAVAQVIINRRDSGKFAKSLCGVIYQRGQFSFTWDGRPDSPSNSEMWKTAQAIAMIAAADDWREIAPDATHFHATRVRPGWHKLQRISSVGNHVFYRFR